MEKINVFDVQVPDGRQIRCMSYKHAGYRLDDIMIIFSHLDISPRSFVGAFCLSLSKT